MILRSIQLQGYRSFAETTTLKFSERITCLTGPSGCGKSNIIRALQSPFCMEDSEDEIIFRGTEKRKRAALAAVKLSWQDGAEDCVLQSSSFGNGFGQIDVSPDGYDFKTFTQLIRTVRSLAELEKTLQDKHPKILLIENFQCENVKLLTELVREASVHHQVVIVTDYKAVMSISNILVGVTMREYGVTSLVVMEIN